MIVLNERHLSRVLREYVEHYNASRRPHVSCDNSSRKAGGGKSRDYVVVVVPCLSDCGRGAVPDGRRPI